MKQRSPSQQGDLDNMCGIYALINIVVYLYGEKIQRRALMKSLLRAFNRRWTLQELFEHGMTFHQVDYLVQRVYKGGYWLENYPLKIVKPFERQKVSISAIMEKIVRFLEKSALKQHRVVLIGTTDHWTLITDMDAENVYFFDSHGRQWSSRRSFSLTAGYRRHKLILQAIYFVQIP